MIQIFALREYFDQKSQKNKTTMKIHPRRAQSVEEIFTYTDGFLRDFAEDNRYNLYFTLANCLESGEERKLDKQHFISFDIDYINTSNWEAYLPPITEILGVKKEEILCLMSGHGLQLHIKIKTPITNESYFKENRKYYNRICDKINKKLSELELPGKADTTMFAPAKLVRFPNTTNRKKNKPDTEAFAITNQCIELDFNLIKCSGLIEVPKKDQTKFFRTPDTAAVLKGCDFLKWAKANQTKVNQEDWYKLGSIVPRLYGEKTEQDLEKGKKLFHSFSDQHPDYDRDETDELIERAMESSFPRLCENIGQSFDCKKCENYGKIKSPIMIKSEEYIQSKETGFRKQKLTKEGVSVNGKPDYLDLAKHYGQSHPYVNDSMVAMSYVYKDNYWQETSKRQIKAFAEIHINSPTPIETERQEFFNLITLQNLRQREFFEQGIVGFSNFKNGILDTKTMELLPHSPNMGFCSILPYEYDEKADCPRFEQFLNEITEKQDELIKGILEFIGYGLVNENPKWGEKALILSGEGRNGKSILTDTVMAVAGEENCSNVTLEDLKDPKIRILLKDKMFNLSQETAATALINAEHIKNIISGETITIHKFHVGMFNMKPRAKIIAACNQTLKTNDTSEGLLRRLLIIPFNAKFEQNQDGDLTATLLKELPGIFNLCVNAFKQAKQKGRFTSSKISEEELHNLHLENSPILAWVEDVITNSTDDAFLSTKDMYIKYEIHNKTKSKFVISYIGFSRKIKPIMERMNKKCVKKLIDEVAIRGYFGIKFSESEAF